MARRHKFSETLLAKPKKTAHKPIALAAKIEIRQLILADIGAEGPVGVFDAFAGDGQMFKSVWHEAASYCGCDLEFYRDGPMAYVADNRRLLRNIDLTPWNLFDLDAWGSPWEQLAIIADRRRHRPGELVGVTITEGTALKVKLGTIPKALATLANVHGPVEGGIRYQGELISKAIAAIARRMNAKVGRRLEADVTGGGSAVQYIGLTFRIS